MLVLGVSFLAGFFLHCVYFLSENKTCRAVLAAIVCRGGLCECEGFLFAQIAQQSSAGAQRVAEKGGVGVGPWGGAPRLLAAVAEAKLVLFQVIFGMFWVNNLMFNDV